MSSTQCNKDLKVLLDNYTSTLSMYKDIYPDALAKYRDMVTTYDTLLDFKLTPQNDSLKKVFEELKDNKIKLETGIEKCRNIANSSIIELLEQSIELNDNIDIVKKQQKKIKLLEKETYSAKGQKNSLFDMNQLKKKNIIILSIVVIILMSIVTYFIFN